MVRFPIFILFVLMQYGVWGQSLTFKHLTMADGLPGHRELQLCEDSYGRIWIGGIGGIGIFDGAQLETITRDDQWGLKGFQVNNIIRGRTGTMWVATNEAVQFLPPGAGKFAHALQKDGIPVKDILLLGETAAGDILGVAEQAVYRYRLNQKHFTLDEGLTRLVQQQGKTMMIKWVSGDQWLMASREHTSLVDVEKAKVVKAYNDKYVWCAEKVDEDHYLLGSFGRDTVSLLNLKTGQMELVNKWPVEDGSVFGGFIGGIAAMGQGKFAMASRYYGVYVVDVPNRFIRRILHNTADPVSIINNFCRTAFVSSGGTLFISSSGLSYTQVEPPFFAAQTRMELDNAETYDAFIHTFLSTDKSTMWIGGNNGLMRWNPVSQRGHLYKVFTKGNTQSPPRTVRSVLTDTLGRIWAGTYGAGIALLQGETFMTLDRDNIMQLAQWPNDNTYALVADGRGSFWVATDGGPAHFNPYTRKGNGFKDHPALSTLNSQTCYYILPAPGRTWFAMQTGVYVYDSAMQALVSIYIGTGKSSPVHSLVRDGKGLIYAACFDGLRIIDENKPVVVQHLSRSDGLYNEQLMGACLDSLGRVWLIGLQGIALYKPEEKRLQSFTVRDGVLKSDFRYNAIYLSPEGKIYAGNDGYNFFDPYLVQNDTSALNVYTTKVQASDSVFNLDGDELVCNPAQRTLVFNYLAADLRMGPYIEYRYHLSGLDTGFVYAGKQRMARYNNLPPGRYHFIAEASVDGIQWYPSAPVNIYIKKALWEKVWFWITLALLLFAGTYYLVRRQIANIRKSADMKRRFESQIAEVRMNLLRAQMNPHFIFNSLNSINHFILSSDRNNASGYLTKFSRLMRLMLDNSRSEWVMLANELKALELYIQLEAMRLNKSFTYTLLMDNETDSDNLMVPPLLLQPFIENAIWHGLMHRKDSEGALKIEIKEKEGRMQISIYDNGIGRKASAEMQQKNQAHRKSHGIMITQERLRMINEIYRVNASVVINDLTDAEGEAAGTEVYIEMDKTQA
jgi:ligand-binding sensor domain-containing protein